MSAAALNARLAAEHPAAARCLSPLGARLYFPRGIPVQAKEAAACAYNATIGQLRGPDGRAAPLDALRRLVPALDADQSFLYAPQGGLPGLRDRWAARLAERASPGSAPLSRPFVTSGITHGLSLLADLFVGPGTEVLLPSPCWDNYAQVFGTRSGGVLRSYSALSPEGFSVEAFAAAVGALRGPAVVVLNFPSNPGGYAPSAAEADQLVAVLTAHSGPLVVLCDDAYQGMVWDAERPPHSLMHRLAAVADPERLLVVSTDGATKELFYFGGRVGFVTAVLPEGGGDALEEKLTAAIRVSVSSVSGTAQAIVLAALDDPALLAQRQALHADLAARWARLRDGLAAAGVPAWPFNAAFFALLPAPTDAEELRHAFLKDGLGLVSAAAGPNLRLSYASLQLDAIDPVVEILAQRLAR